MNKSNLNSIGSIITNNKVTRSIKANPVSYGVAGTYIAGSTLAYAAAGIAVKTALAYSIGTAMLYGSLIYGAHHIITKVTKEAK